MPGRSESLLELFVPISVGAKRRVRWRNSSLAEGVLSEIQPDFSNGDRDMAKHG